MSTTLPMEAVFRNRRGEARHLTVRRCEPQHLDAILALQSEVLRALPSAELFALGTAEEYEESLTLDCCLGAFDGETLVTFSLMIVNRVTPRSLGAALGYDSARMLKAVTYDSTFVAPSARGFGLQRAFLPLKDAVAIALSASEALATVAPGNAHSLNNLLADGFTVVERRPMYGGLDRFILRKTFGKE